MCSLTTLLSDLVSRVQKARYEDFVLNLSSAYAGYQFDLPAFIDFRGRIYRAGVLHFHERDLAKSLIVFSNNGQSPELRKCDELDLRKHLACAAAFKFQKFLTLDDSYQWYMKMHEEVVGREINSFSPAS